MTTLHPGQPTALGTYLPYPQDVAAVGYSAAAQYWLGAGGRRVRMGAACKRAFLATFEAAIERALIPAQCGDVPATVSAFLGADYGEGTNYKALVGLGRYNAASDRAALGGRLSRFSPYEDWNALVGIVVALWSGGTVELARMGETATVAFYQSDLAEFDSGGFVTGSALEGMYPAFAAVDMKFAFADAASESTDLPVVRPWGTYPGGAYQSFCRSWLDNVMESFGLSPSGSSPATFNFVDDCLGSSQQVLDSSRGHAGNWFGSSVSAMYTSATTRRPSSAWAVMQAMLANMARTHLMFEWSARYHYILERRSVYRHYELQTDAAGDYVLVGVEDADETTESDDGVSSILENTKRLFMQSDVDGAFHGHFLFSVLSTEVESSGLLRASRPADGWEVVGSAVRPYITFDGATGGYVCEGIERRISDAVYDATAHVPGGYYPAVSLRDYVRSYGGVVFADRRMETADGMVVGEQRYSIRTEGGGYSLDSVVETHAQWLLNQVGAPAAGTINPINHAEVARYGASQFDGVEVFYPTAPNFGNQYFPTAIRWPGEYEGSVIAPDSGGDWRGRFPFNFAYIWPLYPPTGAHEEESYAIHSNNSALAGYVWGFKAMSTT